MVPAIIMAIVAIASASIQAGVSASQRRKSQREARRLAAIQKQDYMKQQREDRRAVARQTQLGREGLAFKRQQINDEQMDMEKQRQDLLSKQQGMSRLSAARAVTSPSTAYVDNRVLDTKRWL